MEKNQYKLCIVSPRRRQKDKSTKDREAGLKILRALIDRKDQSLIKDVFDSIPVKWQRTILKELEAMEESGLIEMFKKKGRSISISAIPWTYT